MLVERFRPRFESELPNADCFHMLDESVPQAMRGSRLQASLSFSR